MSTSAQQFTGHTQIAERRLHPRVLPKTLIYVACGQSNGGMVLNVSDDGMAISMAIPVGDEAYSNLQVRMNGLAQSIEVHGRMAWTTKSKKRAGIQLVDVSDERRGQIREWLAQEGVRDVNLLPRVPVSAGSSWPAFADAAISPALLEKPRDMSPVAASALIDPPVLAEPHASLLAGLGGTPPEFLGPAQDELVQDEPPFSEDRGAETQAYQGSNPNFPGFRENEWDLASVTMVPRKRSKPEGLSALGLLLLWIAIPSFGIGIMVGRRPLQQWLSRGFAERKNISHVDAPGPEIARARDESPDITSSDIDATGPQSIPARSVETPATGSSQDIKASAATKSFVSTPEFVDTQLLNSMSTQERRAVKAPASTALPENPNANETKAGLKTKANAAVLKNSSASSAAVVKPVTRPNTFAASTTAPTIAGNVSPVNVTSPAVSHIPSSSVASAPATGNSISHLNASGPSPVTQSVSNNGPAAVTQSVNHSASPVPGAAGNSARPSPPVSEASRNNNTVLTASRTQPEPTFSSAGTTYPSRSGNPEPRIAPGAAPRMAPNVRPNMTSSAYAPSYSRSAGPGGAANLAPVNAQPPLHGVMLVARKNNESFLLRLPAESVASGRSVSIEMQRFVMMPAESRWHHHGPIAKLAVGELLTQVSPNQVEMANNARPGDAVTVRAFVDKNGSVEDLKPVSGRSALMPRVMHDVRDWQFDQTLIDGKPVESEVNITVEFRSGPGPQLSRSGREIQAQNSFKP
ncbi:MAG TPA: PilZ domain-containing protein [Verrucomicrobiae bacterium]|nr:PilZ domain-containing protein [Verrucomicrobiae bacterium]